ncbi:hypothetical protein A0H81_06727 [Grifola frondosa]|uniref:Inhibitor I9 domain-containing protein n=1 Tax=Grifola frondosa TaxID=5627 RepID=A0A1C7M8V0_GRIFR|nr:hypothetical protein A0H81_06727 [Grifola frondosa]
MFQVCTNPATHLQPASRPASPEYIDLSPLRSPLLAEGPESGIPRTPSRPSQSHHHSPRAGRHSLQRATARSQRAGTKWQNLAQDVWTFIDKQKGICTFCEQQYASNPTYRKARPFGSNTSTGTLRHHLAERHLDEWLTACDSLDLTIRAKEVQPRIAEYRRRHGAQPSDTSEKQRMPFSQEMFVDAIVEFIIADDQSLNVVESPQLRAIFLLLREDLQDSDIPRRSTIWNRIAEVVNDYLIDLSNDMKNSVGKISFTSDMWSDPNLTPFMAVTAHWIKAKTEETPVGPRKHLAQAFLFTLDRLEITPQIGWITLDNASNNDKLMEVLEHELRRCRIPFDCTKRWIRCFPHIVNLACKVFLTGITNMDYAAENAEDFFPEQLQADSFVAALRRDPVATVRSLIRAIPHAFQQLLSYEKTPVLSDVIPAFESMMILWESHQQKHPETATMIEEAINPSSKFEFYERYFPDEVEGARNMLIQELRTYRNNDIQVPLITQHITATGRTPSKHQWANHVLGLGRRNTSSSPSRTIECLELLAGQSKPFSNAFCPCYGHFADSSVSFPCKRVFSSSEETMTPRCSRIGPELMEALQLLKFSFKQNSLLQSGDVCCLNFTAGLDHDQELKVLEDDGSFQCLEDINSSARLESQLEKDHSKPRRTKPDGAVATLEGAQGFLLGDPVILAPKRIAKLPVERSVWSTVPNPKNPGNGGVAPQENEEIERTAGNKKDSSYIVRLKPGVDKSVHLTWLRERLGRNSEITHDYNAGFLNAFAGKFDEETLNFLRASPDVENISEDSIVQGFQAQQVDLSFFMSVLALTIFSLRDNAPSTTARSPVSSRPSWATSNQQT